MLAEEGDDISNVEAPAVEESSAPKTSEPSPSKSSSPPPSEPKQAASEKSSEPKHAPQLSKPLMPSVLRLLTDYDVSTKDAESIKGTGVRGMLTKGDVLVHLGKAKTPTGTFKVDNRGISAQGGGSSPAVGGQKQSAPQKSEVSTRQCRELRILIAECTLCLLQPLSADSLRSMILSGLASSSHASRSKEMAAAIPSSSLTSSKKSAFDELLDDYEFKSAIPTANAAKASKDPFKGLL